MPMSESLCMKMDTVMSLIRSAEAVPEKDKQGVYRAAKSILQGIEEELDTMITVADTVAAVEEDDE